MGFAGTLTWNDVSALPGMFPATRAARSSARNIPGQARQSVSLDTTRPDTSRLDIAQMDTSAGTDVRAGVSSVSSDFLQHQE